jgi:hypothetical protein
MANAANRTTVADGQHHHLRHEPFQGPRIHQQEDLFPSECIRVPENDPWWNCNRPTKSNPARRG